MLRTDQHGIVVGFPHHDGFLDGITVDDEGSTARLLLRSSTGERHTVTLTGVRSLSVDDFRQGNIVLNLWFLTLEQAIALSYIAPRIHDRFGLDLVKLPADTFVFALDSSYGADMIALCLDANVSLI